MKSEACKNVLHTMIFISIEKGLIKDYKCLKKREKERGS